MSLIDEIRKKKEDYVVGYMEFAQNYFSDSGIIYCFYEAKNDRIYYNGVIRTSFTGIRIDGFVCKNKEGVLKVYDIIKAQNEKYDGLKSGFFVDRDFDPLINNEEIYETSWHSIENYYADIKCLENTFTDIFGLNTHEDLRKAKEIYQDLQNKFHLKVLPVNAWISCHTDSWRNNIQVTVNFDDLFKLDNSIVDETLSSINCEDYDYDKLCKLFKTTIAVEHDNFLAKIEDFKNKEYHKLFRGKFEMRFLISFLNNFSKLLNSEKSEVFSKRYKYNRQFTADDTYLLLNSYAFRPECLLNYIKKIVS
jgi:hypothetical protein